MVKIHCITGLKSICILEQDPAYNYSATTTSRLYECYIEAELYSRTGRIGLPICCSYKQFASSYCEWNEWIKFPVRFCDISRETQIVFTLYSVSPTTRNILGGVTLPLFEQRILRYGRHKLRLAKYRLGDGNIDSKTLFSKLNRQLTVRDQLEAVLTMKLMRKIPQVPWLDALTNRRLLKISKTKTGSINEIDNTNDNNIYLYVDLPNLGYHVVYQEKSKGKKFNSGHHQHHQQNKNTNKLFNIIYDPEIKLNNPINELNKKLSKHLLTANVRPNNDESHKLLSIIHSYNYNEFPEDDRELLWKFRNYLIDNKHALTKFLRCVNQESQVEINIALDLIDKWTPIDISDALELLSGHFTNYKFRLHGINVLKNNASDNDLELYIMQLVQAIRFETNINHPLNNSHTSIGELSQFLLSRSLNSYSFRLLNFLYWSVVVASKSEGEDDDGERKYSYFLTKIEYETQKLKPKYYEEILRQKQLINSLIQLSQYINTNVKGRAEDKKRALKNLLSPKGKFEHINKQLIEKPVIMPLRPEIKVCQIDIQKCNVFKSALCPFLLAFKIYREEDHLDEKEGVDEKEEEEDIEEEEMQEEKHQYLDLKNDEYYKIIWKNGDDLRQDQLIIQMINLMDNLLLEVNLDLCLTPYPVLATGLDNGMLEFVPNSASIANILKKYSDNIKLFLSQNDLTNGKQKLLSKNVDTFVKSCAGYCVITFLLGVGDRHLDNLLITKNGYLFHIDFGFIYGDDPKPWPPPMKICKQMIDAMGGYNSNQYKQFQQHMTSCYNELRKKASLILNLLSLMGQGSIQEIEENVNFVYSKFRLDLNPEQASAYLLNLMEESVNALFTKVVDKIHDWATYWR